MSLLHGPLSASRQQVPVTDESGAREFLGFVLGKECYALPLARIREIMRAPQWTPVPRGPRDVLGIVSVRGEVTTIVDLRRRLCMEEAPLGPRSRVLLVDHGNETMGLLVDKVLHVYRLAESEVEISAVLGNETSSHVMGIGRPGLERAVEQGLPTSDHEILILLDPTVLLKQYGG